jgi:hypothetical protein
MIIATNNEMILRVAKAINKLGYGLGESLELTIAYAAITAMREPTEAMLKADVSLGGYGFGECYQADPKEVWQAMIDESLK